MLEKKELGFPAKVKNPCMRFVLICDIVRAQVPFGTNRPYLCLALKYWASQASIYFSLAFPSTISTFHIYNSENPLILYFHPSFPLKLKISKSNYQVPTCYVSLLPSKSVQSRLNSSPPPSLPKAVLPEWCHHSCSYQRNCL